MASAYELLSQLLRPASDGSRALGSAEMPLDPRLADLMAKFFPTPVFVLDKSRDRIVWASPGGLMLLNVEGKQLQKMSPVSFLEAYFTPAEPLLRLYTQGAQEGLFQGQVHTPQGPRAVQGFWVRLPSEKGDGYEFMLSFQDVTEVEALKQELLQYAEELEQQVEAAQALATQKDALLRELQQQAEKLRLLATATAYSNMMKFILDAEGRVVWVNRTFEQASGWRAEEIVGKHISEVSDSPSFAHLLRGPQDKPRPETLVTAHFVRAPFTEEIYAYDRQGRGYWMLLTLAPILDETGQATHYLGALLNITRHKEREEQLRRQQDELEASLRYAQRIQQRFWPEVGALRKYFSDAVVWNQPQGQVGGDFYQVFPVEGGVLVAMGDGTGHGVPAALLAIYATTLLRRLVREYGADLLKVYTSLQTDIEEVFGGAQGAREGFELALLYYEPKAPRASYLGVGRPLWVLRSGEIYPVSGIKGDVSTTALDSSKADPVVQSLGLQPGDRLYLFSDGVTDQLNAEGKRFSQTRLKSFLQTNAYLPLEEQVSLLRQALIHWATGTAQTDDMLLLAMQV